MTKKVLIIEDDLDIAICMEAEFNMRKWESVSTDSLEQAMQIIENGDITAVVSDVHLKASSNVSQIGALAEKIKDPQQQLFIYSGLKSDLQQVPHAHFFLKPQTVRSVAEDIVNRFDSE